MDFLRFIELTELFKNFLLDRARAIVETEGFKINDVFYMIVDGTLYHSLSKEPIAEMSSGGLKIKNKELFIRYVYKNYPKFSKYADIIYKQVLQTIKEEMYYE